MSGSDSQAATVKLAAARTRLIADKPFIGVLLLHLPFEPAAWCETIATDARRLYYHPGYIARLSFRQTQFVLAHQALHCALGHFARRDHRVRSRWEAACDLAVNLLLVEEGLAPVADAPIDPALRGLSAEEIYPLLGGAEPARSFDRHLFDFAVAPSALRGERAAAEEPRDPPRQKDAGSAADALGSDAALQQRRHSADGSARDAAGPVETEDLQRRWQMRFAQAAQQARHAGRLSATWQRLLAAALEPPLPWRALLARFVSSCAQEDYSFQRPARRDAEFLLPRLRSDAIELHAVLDTSGSIGEAELAQFAAELDALKGQVRARVTVHACDASLAHDGPWSFEPWQPIVLPERLAGGGATDFRPVFEWMQVNAGQPGALLYFTDACGDFPDEAPPYPVLWLVKGNAPVPWGERIGFS